MRIRWGILGGANIAIKRFIPGVLASKNGQVVAIASREPQRASEIAARFEIPRAHDSYEALLADPEIEAVYNPLPNALHARTTIAALEAGKHVLCEKPLANDAAEAQAMLAAAERHGRLLMEAFMYRFHPQHARVRELLENGAIGTPRFVRGAFTFALEPFDRANVRLSAPLGGGALMDVGCYCVNAARMLFAEEPQWASASWDFRDEFGVEVSLAGTLGFSDGRTAVFDCGFRAATPSFYQVAGTKGTILVSDAFTPQSGTTIAVMAGAQRREEHFAAVDQYRLEAEEFGDAILEHRPLRLPASDALGTLRAIAALKASARRRGERVEVASC